MQKSAEVTCFCNILLLFCYKDYLVHKPDKRYNKLIDLAEITQEISQKFTKTLTNINELKCT